MERFELSRRGSFADVPDSALQALREAAVPHHLAGGERLIRQGDKADVLYFVESGRFRVVVDGRRVVAHIEAGEAIGELAFFAGCTRTADVIATRDSSVWEVSRTDFDRIGDSHPGLGMAMLKLVSERLAAATARTASIGPSLPRVIAVVAAGGSTMPAGFVDRLADALGRLPGQKDPVVSASCRTVNLSEGRTYRAWLSEQEARGAYVLLDGTGPDKWADRVCRNADALVMVANATERNVSPNPIELRALQWIDPEQRTLVVAHETAPRRTSGTGDWIEPRRAKLHHHLALDSDCDFAKLARFLTGRAIGLVLAGGGALGCAHLGVIRALRQADVSIDFIGGASAGAAMGAAVAHGLTVDEILDQMEEMFLGAKAMKRLTLPIYSLLDPTVFDQELRKRYGTRDIADQPVQFFAVSTNLSTNSLKVHRRGPLWEAVRASGSLPTILPPFIDEDGNILVDGGVLDNVPVAVMQQLKRGPNIVVSLGDPREIWRTRVKYESIRGRRRLILDLLLRRRRKEDFPSIVEIMSRTMVVASRMASKRMLDSDDVLITPPIIPGMQLLDWHRGRDLAEMAADHVARLLADGDLFRARTAV